MPEIEGYVRPRKDRKDALQLVIYYDGKRLRRVTGFKVGQEAEAEKMLAVVLEELRHPVVDKGPPAEPGSVREWGEKWIEDRKAREKLEWIHEETHLRFYLYPVMGDRPLASVTNSTMLTWARSLERTLGPSGKAPSSKYIRKIASTVRALFKEAVRQEILAHSPCNWDDSDLPEMEANNRVIGSGFELEQVKALISDPRVPEDRRTLYALEFLTGMRTGEAAARTWADWEETFRDDLGRLIAATAYNTRHKLLKPTKTRVEKWIPVHPTLAAILRAWRAEGFEQFTGRKPTPEDLIVPSAGGKFRSNSSSWRWFKEDLERLGIPHQRHYESRSSFINLAEAAGADRSDVALLTHASIGQAKDLYRRIAQLWPRLCRAVLMIKIDPPEGLPLGGVNPAQTGLFTESGGTKTGTTRENAPFSESEVEQGQGVGVTPESGRARGSKAPEKTQESGVSGKHGGASRGIVGALSPGMAADSAALVPLPDPLSAFVEASGQAAARAIELGDREAARRALRAALEALEAAPGAPVLRLVPGADDR